MSDVTDLKAEVLMLRKENKELHADQAHWELGNCPNCPNIVSLQEALEQNARLQRVCKEMHDYIKESCDICDEDYCSSWDEDNECCIFDTYMRKLGIGEEKKDGMEA